MNLYAEERLPEGHPKRERNYIDGDVSSSLIRTVNGRMIVLHHDTDLPRPYSRTNLVQGTPGIVRTSRISRGAGEDSGAGQLLIERPGERG